MVWIPTIDSYSKCLSSPRTHGFDDGLPVLHPHGLTPLLHLQHQQKQEVRLPGEDRALEQAVINLEH